jgi:hypothetical protein
MVSGSPGLERSLELGARRLCASGRPVLVKFSSQLIDNAGEFARLDEQPRCGVTIAPCAPWHAHSCFTLEFERHQVPTSPKLLSNGE